MNQEKDELKTLINSLGCLPLALEQAGSYIYESKISISEYNIMFNKYKKEFLRRGRPYKDKMDTVATTWEISFTQIKESSPLGKLLLNFYSFLAADVIPYELLKGIDEVLMQKYSKQGVDEFSLQEAKIILQRYSLINFIHKNGFIHCLVQEITRMDLIETEDIILWINPIVIIIIHCLSSKKNNILYIPAYSSMLAHVLKVLQYAEEYQASLELIIEALAQVGLCLWETSQFFEAKKVFEYLLIIAEKHYQTLYHPNIASIVNNLGLVNKELGEYNKAITCFEQALEINKIINGTNENLEAINYLKNYGTAYYSVGKYQDAIEIYNRAFEIAEAIINDEVNKHRADLFCNIGVVYEDLGKYDDALVYYQKSLEINQKLYQSNSHPIALSFENIGDAYRLLGKYDAAKEYYQNAYNEYFQILQTEQSEIARIYNKQGINEFKNHNNTNEAQNYFEKALEIDQKIFGKCHPYVARDISSIGEIFASLGIYMKAIDYFGQAISMNRKFYENEHPDIARDLNNLGAAYQHLNIFPTALQYFEQALIINKKFLGDNHIKTLTVTQNINIIQLEILKSKKINLR